MAKAVLINPNNGAIDTRYDPNDIDDPFSYRARDGFMGIGPLWANNDDGTVYMQGHVVIPNPWGDAVTNGTTTTTTDDTTDKDGGDDAETCGGCPPGTVPICLEWGSNLDWLDCMAKELGKGTLIGEVLNKLGLSSVAGLIGLAISIIEQAVKSILARHNIRSAAQRCADETINRCKKWGCSEPGGAGAI